MSHRSITLCFLSFLASTPSLAENRKAPSTAEEIAFQGIADLTLLRDSTLKRYSLMIQGESQVIYDASVARPPLQINRIYKFFAADSNRGLEYLSHCKVMGPESTSRTYEHQYWVEFYKCKDKAMGRYGSASRRPYKVREANQSINEFMEKQRLTGVRLSVFDTLIIHPMFVGNGDDQYGWIERTYLQKSELLEAAKVTQGDVRSKWRWKSGVHDFEIELVQGKAYDYLPVKVTFKSKDTSRPDHFGETEIKWKKHPSGKFLPYVLKMASGSPFGQKQEHHHWVLDWRLGDELPSDFFQCGLSDFRTQFTPIYDFKADVYARPGGLILGTPWKTPEALIEEE